MEYYRGKNILITGAFGGFGLCFISQLLDGGASLILCDTPQSAIPIRDREKACLFLLPEGKNKSCPSSLLISRTPRGAKRCMKNTGSSAKGWI